eukprot:4576053-Amphidinium_carterae.2
MPVGCQLLEKATTLHCTPCHSVEFPAGLPMPQLTALDSPMLTCSCTLTVVKVSRVSCTETPARNIGTMAVRAVDTGTIAVTSAQPCLCTQHDIALARTLQLTPEVGQMFQYHKVENQPDFI